MSTDELMEQRLNDAGQRWRAAHTDCADGGVATLGQGEPKRGRMIGAVIAGIAVAAAVVAGLVLAGHHSAHRAPSAASASALLGPHWSIVRVVDAAGQTTTPAASAYVLFERSGGAATANDGCNAISGTVMVSGNRVSVNQFAETAIGCSTGDHVTIASILGSAMSFSISGDQLTLTSSAGTLIAHQAVTTTTTTTDPKALVGVTWQLASVSESGSDTAISGRPPTLSFDGNGHFLGDDGCVGFTGVATLSDASMTLQIGGELQPACPRQPVKSVLTGRVTWAISGAQLTITKAGVGSLTYDSTGPAVPTSGTSATQ